MEEPGRNARPLGRRAFLGVLAVGAVALVAGEPVRRVLDAITPGEGALVGGRWRIYNVSSPMPVFEPASWRLRVDGLVSAPRELTYDDFRALPRVEQVSDFHCVTGWSVEGVRWAGVRLDDLLGPARLLPEAGALVFHSAEQPYLDSLTLEQAFLPDVLLASEMDGEPLTRGHGAPVRLVIPQMYGYKGVKWVQRIEAVERPVAGFWEQRGWDWDAWVGRSNGGS
jgi:DMSO/TMAO reductase YedYZ molybdopterin-dependent catalytic subunit